MTSASNSSDGADGRKVLAPLTVSDAAGADPESGSLPERVPDTRDAVSQFHGQPLTPGDVRIILFPEAIEEIAAHTVSDTGREVGGVLLGAAYRHHGEIFVDVRHALPAHTSDHGPIHFTFNADAWSQVHRDRAAQHPDLDIVGWFHTHPGLGIFFSADDVVVHSAAFVLPWHVALVIDPLSRHMGAFAWKKGTLAGLPGFYERRGRASTRSVLPWRIKRGEIWTESYMEHMAQQRRRDVPSEIARTIAGSWQAYAALALVILMLAAGVIGATLHLRGQNETLRSIVTSLAEQSMQEAQARGVASCPSVSLRLLAPVPGGQLNVSQEVIIVGTATVPNATAYRLEVRPSDAPAWWPMGSVRKSTEVGQLLTWDPSSFPPGPYDLRLIAVDSEGQMMQDPEPCIIQFELSGDGAGAQ